MTRESGSEGLTVSVRTMNQGIKVSLAGTAATEAQGLRLGDRVRIVVGDNLVRVEPAPSGSFVVVDLVEVRDAWSGGNLMEVELRVTRTRGHP